MGETNWTYESESTILQASPQLREQFRAAMRAQLEEDEGRAPDEEELEEMAAFAWFQRAKKICAKTDVLLEEGVPAEEVRRIAKVEPPERP